MTQKVQAQVLVMSMPGDVQARSTWKNHATWKDHHIKDCGGVTNIVCVWNVKSICDIAMNVGTVHVSQTVHIFPFETTQTQTCLFRYTLMYFKVYVYFNLFSKWAEVLHDSLLVSGAIFETYMEMFILIC